MSALRRRGQPIRAFALLLGSWMAVRVVAWTLAPGLAAGPDALVAESNSSPSVVRVPRAVAGQKIGTRDAFSSPVPAPDLRQSPLVVQPQPIAPLPAPVISPSPVEPLTVPPPVTSPAESNRTIPVLAGGHQVMFLAALSQVPLPPAFAERQEAAARGNSGIAPVRWSGDGWLLLRRDGDTANLAAIRGSYGASQVGAVLRYRIDPDNRHRPALYLRASAALGTSREQELAIGFSARPAARLPMTLMAELRGKPSDNHLRLRPAVLVVTELPTAKLPLGLRGEAYLQAGYVGGADATGFVDGQARLDHKVMSLAGAELRAGGAVWGGGQRGASRLDAGPSASVSFRLSTTAPARLSADWRFRIAGRADPASGPALTLSAGF